MYSNNNNNGEEEDMIENLKTNKQKLGVTRKKEEKGKIREKTKKQRKKRKEKKKASSAGMHQQFISLFTSQKSCPLPKTKKRVPLGTNHSSPLPSK